MWIEQLPSGKYKYCDRYRDPATGQNKRVSVTLDKNNKQTEKLAREILRSKMYEVRPASITLSELIDLYIKEQEQTVKMSTCVRNQGILERVLDVLGDVQLDKLTAGYIRKRFMESGKSNTTLNEYLVRLKAMLRWAYKYDYIQDIRYIDKLDRLQDTSKREKVSDKFLERSELEALIESMDGQWKDLTAFLALSGLRFGEAAALTRGDVDTAIRVINVDKTYDWTNDITTAPKTYTSTREVYMQNELLDLCKDIIHRGNIIQISNLLFYGRSGHICYDAYRMYLRKHSEAVLGRVVTPHVLRHTHASLLMEDGVDIETISYRLGHSDSKITKEIYLHVTKNLEDKRNEQLKDIRIIDSL